MAVAAATSPSYLLGSLAKKVADEETRREKDETGQQERGEKGKIKRKKVSILDGEKLGQRNRWKERDSGRK